MVNEEYTDSSDYLFCWLDEVNSIVVLHLCLFCDIVILRWVLAHSLDPCNRVLREPGVLDAPVGLGHVEKSVRRSVIGLIKPRRCPIPSAKR